MANLNSSNAQQKILTIWREMGDAGNSSQAQKYLNDHLGDMVLRVTKGEDPDKLWNEFRYSPFFGGGVANLAEGTLYQASPYFDPKTFARTKYITDDGVIFEGYDTPAIKSSLQKSIKVYDGGKTVNVQSPYGKTLTVEAKNADKFTGEGFKKIPGTQNETQTPSGSSLTGQLTAKRKVTAADAPYIQKGQEFIEVPISAEDAEAYKNAGYEVVGQSDTKNGGSTATGQSGASSGTSTGTSQGKPTFDLENFSDLPPEIKNSGVWQQATQGDKMLIYAQFKAKEGVDPQASSQLMQALEGAMKSVDPYYKEKIRIAQDEITRSITGTEEDMATKTQRLNERVQQIKQDLAMGKEDLSIDQQGELARQLRDNQSSLNTLQQNAAEVGLAFSSPRQEAEAQLMADQQDIRESTQRKYARSIRDAELDVQRKILLAQQGIQDVATQGKQSLTETQRKGETYLGSALNPTVSGVQGLGNIQGTLLPDVQGKAVNLSGDILKFMQSNNS